MRARASLFATIAVVAVAGCKDSGLPDRNLPFEEAAHRPPDALVQAVYPELRQTGATMPMDSIHAGMGGRAMPMDSAHAGMAGGARMPMDSAHAGMAGGARMPMDSAHAGMGGAMAAGGGMMASGSVRIGEQTFVPAGMPLDLDPAMLSQVGAGGGMSFHAVRGDDAPFDRVYMTHPGGRYVTYLPVHDDSGDPAARLSAQHDGMSGGGAAH